MIEITRRLEFDAGHRVVGHEGKCKHLHGHRYRAEITVSAAPYACTGNLDELDELGRVVDFGCIKSVMGGWIDENWDHNMILSPKDPLLEIAKALSEASQRTSKQVTPTEVLTDIVGCRPFILTTGNPTAENLAAYLARVAKTRLPPALVVRQVRLYETPNCWADYIPDIVEMKNADS